jgi:NAD(P)-dependent dehydrogenase (short-subunit alcohol dehydrogenase family)
VQTVLLQDRVAVVTGASMGIGEAIAWAFAREGARVVINSRSRERAERVATALSLEGREAMAVEADVSRRSDAQRLVQETKDRWGRLDIMVNNAGVSMIAPSENLSEEDWRRTLDINITGAFFCAQAAARAMIPQRRGVIINISSILGETGLPKRAAYCASKHALNGLTKVLAAEWAPYGIRVVGIAPGYIRTPMDVRDTGTGDYTEADIESRTPLGRYGTPEEVARAAVFLASDNASYITGVTLLVDGGWTAFGGWQGLMERLAAAAKDKG